MDDPQTTRTKVLIAEDDPALANVLKLAFARAGFDVKVTRNGLEAHRVAQSETFDVVCSDYQMPGMNGGELLRSIRDAGASQHAVCMLCSAKSYELDCDRLKSDLGLESIFYKPFSLAEIVATAQAGLAKRAASSSLPAAST